MAQNADRSVPRVFIVHSPFVDNNGNILAIDFDDVSKMLVLQPLKDPTLNRQRFRVYIDGPVQSLAQGVTGYWTRVTSTVDGVTVTRVHLDEQAPGKKEQQWSFTWGPVPPPAGGPNGGDRYTITADTVPRRDDVFTAYVLTAPIDHAVGVPLTVEKTDIPLDRKVDNRKLWFYYWLPGVP